MSNPNPVPAPSETQFKPKWKSGQTRTIRIPVILSDNIMAIARIIDRNPEIADQVLKFAQSLEQAQK